MLVALAALAATAVEGGAQCVLQPSTISARGHSQSTTAPTSSFNGYCGYVPCYECVGPHAGGSFDLAAGSLSASVCAGIDPGGVGSAGVVTDDLYWLEGPPSAGAVTFRVRLATAVSGRCPFRGDYGLNAGGGGYGDSRSFDWWYPTTCSGTPVFTDTLVVEKAVAVGEVFEIKASVSIVHGLNNCATIAGALSFAGLPAGFHVRSCKGYDFTVPAASHSWGSLKLRYR